MLLNVPGPLDVAAGLIKHLGFKQSTRKPGKNVKMRYHFLPGMEKSPRAKARWAMMWERIASQYDPPHRPKGYRPNYTHFATRKVKPGKY